MKNTVLNALKNYVQVNEEEGEAFISILKEKKLKRKEQLIRQGDVCDFAVFIFKGCLRYYYIQNGEDCTGQFFFENGWYSDYESFLSGNPSIQNIEALEDCVLYAFTRKDLENLYIEFPVFERFGRLMAERAVLGLMKKNEILSIYTHEERYLQLITERPKVIERVSLKHIASYLGMKPESLSRIRSRLSKKQNS
ncbi:Crp/Fnr family transcriptional regulator [Yeosuana sp.]|uniref:Crp/Fnr family transcriptional regulator n=1 Tax=Yeosuana sp. TaxID=2529388 RepID=UPI00404A0F55